MRQALAFVAMFIALLSAAPAFAAPPPGLDLAAWVSGNTDLAVSQVAIAGPENVYSLEPLGSRMSTGEVLALVRTEAVNPEWRVAHGFQSWDAHLLFDCVGARVRVLRSASYAERDRQGAARSNDPDEAWFSPEAATPAATLLAAACDPAFSWPLRGPAAASPAPPKLEGGLVRASIAGSDAPIQRAMDRVEAAPVTDGRPARTVLARIATGPSPAAIEPPSTGVPSAPVVRRSGVAPAVDSFLQKASYVSGPAVTPAPSSAHEAVVAPRRAGLFTRAGTALRSGLRWAGAGPGWLAQRLELAFRRGSARPDARPGVMRQAQLS
jgi:hypothetical protein